MTKTHKNNRDLPKNVSFLIIALIVAFFFSYSLSVHFLDWYAQPVIAKVVLLVGLTAILGGIFHFVQNKILKKVQTVSGNLSRYLLLFSIILLFFLLIYFIFYYEPTPFFTTHTLVVSNISENSDDWEPVEITSLSYLDGVPVATDDLSFDGEFWIADGNILLKPSSSILLKKTLIGALKLSFRSDDQQGSVLVVWDGQEKILDLGEQGDSQVLVSLSPHSWGSPNTLWLGLAVLSVISDFFVIFAVVIIIALLFLTNYLDQSDTFQEKAFPFRLDWVDLLIAVALLGISIVLSMNLFDGHFGEYTELSGDAGNYASFAAAKTYPTLFQNDPLLGNADNYDLYSTYHISLTQILFPVVGNFGTAFMILQMPLTFMQLFGFYLLGKQMYKSRTFGLLLSALTFIFIQMNLSEFWGYVTSPIPRFSFQAVLPFLLFFVLRMGGNVKRWPLLLAITGATIYVHSVSAPVWSVAIILCLWFMAPRSAPFSLKCKYMLIALLVFVFVLAPFILKYFQKTAFGEAGTYSIEEVYSIIDYRLAQGMVDFQTAIGDFFAVLTGNGLRVFFFAMSLLSLAWMNFMARDPDEKKKVIAVTMWLAGVLSVSVLFPMVDFAIAEVLDRNPLEIQFLRAMRNFFPLFYILFLWPFASMYNTVKSKDPASTLKKVSCVLLCIGFLALWCNDVQFLATPLISRTLGCWNDGKAVCPENEELAVRSEFFRLIKEETPEGASILSDDLAIRYYSLRPLAFAKKDGASFSFSNHNALLAWYGYSRAYDELWKYRDDPGAYVRAYKDFAQMVKAEYLVLEEPYSSLDSYPPDLTLIFSRGGYALFEVQGVR